MLFVFARCRWRRSDASSSSSAWSSPDLAACRCKCRLSSVSAIKPPPHQVKVVALRDGDVLASLSVRLWHERRTQNRFSQKLSNLE